MKKYKTLGVVRFVGGVLGLEKAQVEPRQARLKKKGVTGNKYEVLLPVEFKAGEVVGLDDAPKVLLDVLEPVEPAEPAEPAKKDSK